MATTYNPKKICNNDQWSDICIHDLEKYMNSRFSNKYSKNDIKCALNNLNVKEIYSNPKDLTDNLEDFLEKINPLLKDCKDKRISTENKIFLTLSLILLFIIIFVYILYCSMNNKSKKK